MGSSGADAHVLRGQLKAQELRTDVGLGNDPIGDLWELVRAQGTELAFEDFGPSGPDGLYYWDGAAGLIVVNTNKEDVAQQRFTAAHELGHHLMHGGQPGETVSVVDQTTFDTTNSYEREANAFARRLLLPDGACRAAFGARPAAQLRADDIVDLMHQYGTSYQMTVYSLHNAGRIQPRDRDRLIAEGKGQVRLLQRMKAYDPSEMAPADPLPPEYLYTVLDMARRGSIELARAAELLRRDESAVSAMIGDYGDDGDDDLDLEAEIARLLEEGEAGPGTSTG